MNKWVITILISIVAVSVYTNGVLKTLGFIVFLIIANAVGYVVWGIPVNAYRMIFKKEKFRFNYLNEDSNGYIPYWLGVLSIALILYYFRK